MTQTPTTPAEPDENGEPTAVSVAEEAVVDEGSGLEARDDEAAADEAPAGGTRAADAAVAAPVTDDTALADEIAAPTEEPVVQESSDVEPDVAVVADTELAVEGSSDVEAEVVAMAEVAVSVADGPAAAESVVPVTDESPAPAPGPRPSPASLAARAVPRPPSGPRPAPEAPAAATAPVVVAAPVAALDPVEAAAAAAFGRVAEDGTVFVTDGEEEREVGQVPGATSDDALTLYVRRFLDLRAKVILFESRLAATDLSIKEIDGTLDRLTEELAAPAAVGDLVGLRARLDGLREVAAVRRAAAEAERAAARAAALEARTAIVEEAEQISGTDPTKIQWRPAGERLRQLLDQWKEAQRSGPRLDRPSEEALWKRFSHARTTFDRERRHFFAELESRNSAAKATKEALVDQAERLATSSDWAGTASAFRDLMAQWKLAGRASRPVDDALWARFRAAQDAFFGARDAAAAATDEEFQANLAVKERLLVEAEALLPIKDLASAKASLRSIQDRWDAAGKVPRGDIQRIEARLHAVEQTVRDADDAQWRRGNPETRARAEGMEAQLEQAIAGLEADLAKATAAKDARKIADAEAALEARRSWLEQVQRAARDARG